MSWLFLQGICSQATPSLGRHPGLPSGAGSVAGDRPLTKYVQHRRSAKLVLSRIKIGNYLTQIYFGGQGIQIADIIIKSRYLQAKGVAELCPFGVAIMAGMSQARGKFNQSAGH
jgi:hypothetical protein